MKIIIAGSRNFPKELWPLIFGLVASSGFDITEIVSGGAVGADQFGEYHRRQSVYTYLLYDKGTSILYDKRQYTKHDQV